MMSPQQLMMANPLYPYLPTNNMMLPNLYPGLLNSMGNMNGMLFPNMMMNLPNLQLLNRSTEDNQISINEQILNQLHFDFLNSEIKKSNVMELNSREIKNNDKFLNHNNSRGFERVQNNKGNDADFIFSKFQEKQQDSNCLSLFAEKIDESPVKQELKEEINVFTKTSKTKTFSGKNKKIMKKEPKVDFDESKETEQNIVPPCQIFYSGREHENRFALRKPRIIVENNENTEERTSSNDSIKNENESNGKSNLPVSECKKHCSDYVSCPELITLNCETFQQNGCYCTDVCKKKEEFFSSILRKYNY